jgi:organic radical activating enzyme
MSIDRGLFKHIRVQILYPCNAKCSWCATHRKNPLFSQLYKNGISDQIHDFYVQVIRRFRPQEVFISGGEPLLYPKIADFLNDIQVATEQINLFTSYQFSEKLCQRIPFGQMPQDKILLCHTTISFAPQEWHEMTAGFPFDLYVNNIRAIARLPLRKRFKFIVNHPYLDQEIRRFQELVSPDHTFEFGLKVINDQGGGQNEKTIQQSKAFTKERIQNLDRLLVGADWGQTNYKVGSVETMGPLLQDGDVTRCHYRQEPAELRLAFFRANQQKQILKYRYCPYFPSDFGYRFHIGRDDLEKLESNYFKGKFHDRCRDCRFLKYSRNDKKPGLLSILRRPERIPVDTIEIY